MKVGIILAGGSSGRLSELKVPKQFVEVGGVPLIMYCLQMFERCANIDALAIVAMEPWQEQIRKWLEKYGIGKFKMFVLPGRTRQHSIYNGMLAVQSLQPEHVIIHDAARPLVTELDIRSCINESEGYDGATPAIPLTETIYQSEDGATITDLLNRDKLLAGQTPECYDYAKYLKAHKTLCNTELVNIRGSSEVAAKAGMKIHLYKGNPQNFKVTTIVDFEYAKYFIKERSGESVGIA
jgi:2-C-methyl-D-erythritol 4-phosphate cytidylyltransferase